jgi:uroporphyrin-3 C-methyltransferase
LLGLAALALGSAATSWHAQQRMQQLETELVKRQQDSQTQAQEARLMARQAQDLVRDTATHSAALEAKLAEVALQRTQVEDLIQSMSRSRDENLVVDIEAALLLAMQQASLTGSAEPLVVALQTSDERLARAKQPRLDQIRRAVAKDLDRIKGTRLTDLPSLAIKVDEAIRLIDELPLSSQTSLNAHHDQAALAASGPPPGNPVGAAPITWSDRLLSWGGQASRTMWSEAQGLIRVTRIARPEGMLLSPEQGFFLRENIKLRLLNARLNLLSRQTGSASADLAAAQNGINRYFDAQSAKAKLVSSVLSDVSAQSSQTQLPRPDDTLAALTAVAGGR